MRRNLWLPALSILLTAMLCLCIAVCGVSGLFLLQSVGSEDSLASAAPTAVSFAAMDRVERRPSSAQRATADLLAGATIPKRDLLTLAQRLQGIPIETPPIPDNPADYDVGDALTFWVHDVQSNSFFTTTAILRFETPHAYWWIEEEYDIADRDLERSATRFEERTYPTSQRYFGSEWNPGIDGDPHVFIFLGYVPGVGGYFSAPDEYPANVRPHSNEHEMFYINLENALPGNAYFDGVLAHEFEHMIHWAVDRNEDSWVNEGLAELAAHVSGYDVGDAGRIFGQTPDTQLTTWPELADSAPHYGASYLFLAYFLERYGEEAIRQLVAEPANGIAGFERVLDRVAPTEQSFEDIFGDWIVANYLDARYRAEGRYGYADLRLEQPFHSERHEVYPASREATVRQYAADYILLEGNKDLSINFAGTPIVPLVGNRARTGQYQWWSSRGDDGDATLSRSFDLSGLEEATLHVWMWYDLEADYDYAYVEVSTDGGQTWSLLANQHTTVSNPSGNSYGPALTGTSGGGDQARWVRHTFDLSPFAGQEAILRFEVITDEAVNHPGLCIDGIAIPELGYSYDPEEGDGGWRARGWVRVTDHVPQEYLVQLISVGREPAVQQMVLDGQQRGSLTVSGLGKVFDRAVLVVSALAPMTTEPAAYSYQISEAAEGAVPSGFWLTPRLPWRPQLEQPQ